MQANGEVRGRWRRGSWKFWICPRWLCWMEDIERETRWWLLWSRIASHTNNTSDHWSSGHIEYGRWNWQGRPDKSAQHLDVISENEGGGKIPVMQVIKSRRPGNPPWTKLLVVKSGGDIYSPILPTWERPVSWEDNHDSIASMNPNGRKLKIAWLWGTWPNDSLACR